MFSHGAKACAIPGTWPSTRRCSASRLMTRMRPRSEQCSIKGNRHRDVFGATSGGCEIMGCVWEYFSEKRKARCRGNALTRRKTPGCSPGHVNPSVGHWTGPAAWLVLVLVLVAEEQWRRRIESFSRRCRRLFARRKRKSQKQRGGAWSLSQRSRSIGRSFGPGQSFVFLSVGHCRTVLWIHEHAWSSPELSMLSPVTSATLRLGTHAPLCPHDAAFRG